MSSFERLDDWPPGDRFAPAEPGPTAPGFEPHGGSGAAVPAEPAPAADPAALREHTDRAYREGLAAGRAEVPDVERSALRTATTALEDAAVEILAQREGGLATLRREALELAVAIAETLLRHSLADDARGLAARIEAALERLAEAGPLRLHLAGADLERIRATATPELERVAGREALELVADAELAPGEFRLEAGAREADGRLQAMLRAVREVLADAAVEAADGEVAG